MTARIIQIVCAFYLVAMSMAAGFHWWSVREITQTRKPSPSRPASVASITSTQSSPTHQPSAAPVPTSSTQQITPLVKKSAPAVSNPSPHSPTLPAYPSSSSSRDEFYTSLLRQIENLQNQNRDLIDQLAETNRELMKLEFRVDMHSSQFRPLPVTEDRQESYHDEDQGVLPPRPVIIEEPFGE